MWQIYDDLINMVPRDIFIKDFLAGLHWFLVRSSGIGMAMTPCEGQSTLHNLGRISGKPVYEVAKYIKSWNNFEAALGLAAINSVVNSPEMIKDISKVHPDHHPQKSVFLHMKEEIRGKKVAVIGHFRDLEEISSCCELSILERRPVYGDFPDPACEYILPHQDYVFITATTLINKTLPRLLELSKKAYVVLVGPSTPFVPCMFTYGIDMLAGTTIIDGEKVWSLIQEGDQHQFFQDGGKMIKIYKEEVFKDLAI